MRASVVGLDLSLTSTGIALIGNGELSDTKREKSTGKKADTWTQRAARLNDLADRVLAWVDDYDPTLVVIESPSYGSVHGSQHDRSGLWWMIAAALHEMQIPVATVSPNGRAKYASGNGRAGKDEVLAAVVTRYASESMPITGNDVADAVVLAAMGSRWLGVQVEKSLPAANLLAMDGAAWPERRVAA